MKIELKKRKSIVNLNSLKPMDLFVTAVPGGLGHYTALAKQTLCVISEVKENGDMVVVQLDNDYAVVKRRGPILVHKIKWDMQHILTEDERYLKEFDVGTSVNIIDANGLIPPVKIIVKDPTKKGDFVYLFDTVTGQIEEYSGDVTARKLETILKV